MRMEVMCHYLKALDLGILSLLQVLEVFGGFFLSFIELISKSGSMSLHILELGITGVDLRKNQGGEQERAEVSTARVAPSKRENDKLSPCLDTSHK